MRKEQLIAAQYTTAFTLSLIAMPILIYCYMTATSGFTVWSTLCEINFLIFMITGTLGTYKTIIINHKLEGDMLDKLKKQGIDVDKDGFNAYKINKERKTYTMNFSLPPTETVYFDPEKRIIKYI